MAKLRFAVSKAIVPDKHVFLVNTFLKTALKIINDNSIKHVIVSSPPFSMQLVGYKLKKILKNNIKIISDYRDSWNNTPIHAPNNTLSSIISKRMEKKILLSCDFFTYISNPILSKVKKNFQIDIASKSFLIMNGFTYTISGMNIKSPSNKIKVGYFGSVSNHPKVFRNANNLFLLLGKKTFKNRDLEFHFFGQMQLYNIDLKNFPMVHYHGSFNHTEVAQKMAEIDYLMVIHSEVRGCDEVITGKFFEYVAVKKPIICLSPPHMELNKLVRKYEIGEIADINNIDDLETFFNSLRKPQKSYYENIDISKFSRDYQYQTFLTLLDK